MTDDDLIQRGDALKVAAEVFDRLKKKGAAQAAFGAAEVCEAIAALKPASGGVGAPAEDATAKGETPGEMLDRLGIDGVKWAAEFRTTALRLGYSDMDEGWLIGWFCNAIMAGYDRATTLAAFGEGRG